MLHINSRMSKTTTSPLWPEMELSSLFWFSEAASKACQDLSEGPAFPSWELPHNI